MKFIGDLEKVTDIKYKIGFIHNMPFDDEHGLGKTQAELESIGILVEEVPEPQIAENQRVAGHFINPTTKEIWYEYEDIPPTTEEILQQQINDLNMAMAAILGGAM